MPINFKDYKDAYWTEFVINGYVYRTDDRYWAEGIIAKAKHEPGKAWNFVQAKCNIPTGEFINGKQIMSSMSQLEAFNLHDPTSGS